MPEPVPFTVIIPVRNGRQFIAETLRSVLAQTYPATEVIVVDDGSKDDTVEVVSQFGDAVRVIRRPASGVSSARNFGMGVTHTEWVAFVDGDDLWLEQHLQNLASAIQADPTVDIVYSGLRQLWVEAATGAFYLNPHGPDPTPTVEDMPSVLMRYCAFNPSSAAVRCSAALAAGGFDPRIPFGEDWDLWLRMLQRGSRLGCCLEPTAIYRIHELSASHKVKEAIGFYREIVNLRVVPQLPWHERFAHGRRVISSLEASGAIRLRQNGLPGALPLMLRSIVTHPFHMPERYKQAAHMMLRGYQRKAHS